MNSRSASALCCAGTLALLAVGCGQPVREDRTIQMSTAGGQAGFQHGAEGIFIADPAGGPPLRLFKPGPEVTAVTPPLWSPDGKQLIFATAQSSSGQAATLLPRDPPPAGSISLGGAVIYTCWLRGKKADDRLVELFQAPCNHPGYVAANLAVRWHPAGNGILHIRKESGGHGLFSFELATKNVTRVFPHLGDGVIFDLAPDGKHVICVLGSQNNPGANDGIWIGTIGGGDWWRVSGSENLAAGRLPSLLEQLRATRPAWTIDGRRFAFVACIPGPQPDKPGKCELNVVTMADKSVRKRWENSEPLRDLHWSPDGQTIGLLEGADGTRLQLISANDGPNSQVAGRGVAAFPGWDRDGNYLAYIADDGRSRLPGEDWALLYARDPVSQQAVYLLDGTGQGAPQETFHGLRVTFPNWAPSEPKLSMWLTYQPAYRCWPVLFLGLGRGPGDPAATIDASSGKLSWMPVNPRETIQIGHLHLARGDNAEAERLYREAEPKLTIAERSENAFFFYVCATRMKRPEEAKRWLAVFRKELPPLLPPHLHAFVPEPPEPGTVGFDLRWLRDPKSLAGRLARDISAGEIYLSLAAVDDGVAFFRTELAAAVAPPEKLATAVVLGQLLLLNERRPEYVQLMLKEVVPQALPLLADARSSSLFADGSIDRTLVLAAAGLTLLPLADPEFLKGLPDQSVRDLLGQWQQLEAGTANPVQKQLIELALAACWKRLGQDANWKASLAKLKGRQVADVNLDTAIGGIIASVRKARMQVVRDHELGFWAMLRAAAGDQSGAK